MWVANESSVPCFFYWFLFIFCTSASMTSVTSALASAMSSFRVCPLRPAYENGWASSCCAPHRDSGFFCSALFRKSWKWFDLVKAKSSKGRKRAFVIKLLCTFSSISNISKNCLWVHFQQSHCGWVGEWIDDGWMEGCMDRWMDRFTKGDIRGRYIV